MLDCCYVGFYAGRGSKLTHLGKILTFPHAGVMPTQIHEQTDLAFEVLFPVPLL